MPNIIFIDLASATSGTAHVFDKNTGRHIESLALPDAGLSVDIDEAYLGIPLSMLDFRTLSLPVSDPEKIRQLLPFELEGIILAEPGACVIDAVVLGPSASEKDQYDVLAVYMVKSALKPILDDLAARGIDPRVVCSIELSAAIEGGGNATDIESRLLAFGGMPDDERVRRAWREIARPAINLRRGELGYTRDTRRSMKGLMVSAALLSLILIALGADLGVRIHTYRTQAGLMENSIKSVYASAFPAQKYTGTQGLTYKMQARIKELEDRTRSLMGVRALDFMNELNPARPAGVTYTEIALERDSVTLHGRAEALSGVQEAQAALGRFLADVQITETGQTGRDGMPFVITARRASK